MTLNEPVAQVTPKTMQLLTGAESPGVFTPGRPGAVQMPIDNRHGGYFHYVGVGGAGAGPTSAPPQIPPESKNLSRRTRGGEDRGLRQRTNLWLLLIAGARAQTALALLHGESGDGSDAAKHTVALAVQARFDSEDPANQGERRNFSSIGITERETR